MHNVVNTTDVNLFSIHYSLCDIIFRQRNICGHSNCRVVLVTTTKIYKPLNYKNQVVTYHYVATDAQQNVFLVQRTRVITILFLKVQILLALHLIMHARITINVINTKGACK